MKRLVDQTLYEILEVPPDASPAAIAAAVDRAQALYGPGSLATYTLMSSEEAELLGRRIEEARATLLDPAARRRYDDDLAHGRDEVRAAANGAAQPPPWGGELPPVIPARRAAPEDEEEGADDGEDEREEGEGQGEEEAATTAPPAPEPPPAAEVAPAPSPAPPAVRPILLSREIVVPAATPAPLPPAPASPVEARPAAPPPAPPPAAAAAPKATPAPTATPVPQPTPVPMVAPPAPPAPAMPADATAWTGEVLRQLREARGITLQQLSERTKVTRHHIENIEADRYAALPAPVYLRGILLSLARELRLDGQKVARSYLERFAAGTAVQGTAPKPR